jgi:hypothetical protein
MGMVKFHGDLAFIRPVETDEAFEQVVELSLVEDFKADLPAGLQVGGAPNGRHAPLAHAIVQLKALLDVYRSKRRPLASSCLTGPKQLAEKTHELLPLVFVRLRLSIRPFADNVDGRDE